MERELLRLQTRSGPGRRLLAYELAVVAIWIAAVYAAFAPPPVFTPRPIAGAAMACLK